MASQYSIAEIAAHTRLTVHTLRYYERLGLIGPVGRTKSGHRSYQSHDLEALAFVLALRATGMPVSDMRRMGALRAAGAHTQAARLELLFEHRNRVRSHMRELEKNLEAIERKLSAHGWDIDTKGSRQ
jgi:DNA-binding transcriptional MerR regulator